MFSLSIFAQSGAFEAVRNTLPHDPASLFVLALSAIAIVAVIVGGRNKPGKGSGPSDVG